MGTVFLFQDSCKSQKVLNLLSVLYYIEKVYLYEERKNSARASEYFSKVWADFNVLCI